MLGIRVTERDQYKKCRRAWHYAYRENLIPKNEAKNAAWLGTAVHAALAAYYQDGADPVEFFDNWFSKQFTPDEWSSMWGDEQEKIKDQIELGQAILKGYVPFAKRNDDFDEIVAVEDGIKIRIPGTYVELVGHLDLLVRWRGKLWVMDHKTYTNFVSAQDLELDDQMTAYLWLVWQKYGEMPGGAIYNQLRKKIPAEPMLLKSGKLSKDKSIDTTPEKLLAAIKEHNLDESEYTDVLTHLGERRFYRREIVARTPTELKNFTSQLAVELKEMKRRTTPIYPHATRECAWFCQFRLLCKAQNEGGDVAALKEYNYERKM